MSRPTTFAPVSVRRRKIENGTSGATERRSIATKAPSSDDGRGEQADRLRRAPAGVGRVDQRVDEHREAGGDADRAGDVEGAATRTRRGSRAISRGASSAATMPIGTFTHSTHSQPTYSVSTPPSSTPAAPPEPATAPQAPSALLRSAPSRKVVVTIESAAGERIAAPRPWTARAAISAPSDSAKPPTSEASAKRIEAAHEHAPAPEQVGHPPAEQQEAAEGEHVGVDDPGEVVLGEVEVASPIVGSATLTIEASRTTTNCATQSSASAIQRRRSNSWASVIVVPFRLCVRIIGTRVPVSLDYTESEFRLQPATAPTTQPPQPRAPARRRAPQSREGAASRPRAAFAEHGLDAQIDEIARGAGVGVGTVYRHFPTKDDLLEALAQARFEGLAERPPRRSRSTTAGRASSSS